MQMYSEQKENQNADSNEIIVDERDSLMEPEKQIQPKTLELRNFVRIISSCEDALKRNKFIGIAGEPGLGKTTALEYFRDNNENVFMVTVKPSMKTKQFWISVFEAILEERQRKFARSEKNSGDDTSDLMASLPTSLLRETENQMVNIRNNPDLYFIISQIIKNVKCTGGLIILDEAGKFSNARMLEFIHELKDGLRKYAGIIIAGPDYFKKNLIKWNNARVSGIPELFSRINYWEDLQYPGRDEVREICKAYHVTDDKFISELQSCKNFRLIYNKIVEHLQELEEIKNELSNN